MGKSDFDIIKAVKKSSFILESHVSTGKLYQTASLLVSFKVSTTFLRSRHGAGSGWAHSGVAVVGGYPVAVEGDVGVHPQGVGAGTALAPGGDPDDAVLPRLATPGHQGAPGVSLTSVLTPGPSTDHPRCDEALPHHKPGSHIVRLETY